MKRIQLTQGKFALVDDEYYDQLVAIGPWYYNSAVNQVVGSSNGLVLARIVCKLSGTLPGSRVLRLDNDVLNNQRKNLLATFEERFWARVEIREINECWPWRGRTQGGYGKISRGKFELLAH